MLRTTGWLVVALNSVEASTLAAPSTSGSDTVSTLPTVTSSPCPVVAAECTTMADFFSPALSVSGSLEATSLFADVVQPIDLSDLKQSEIMSITARQPKEYFAMIDMSHDEVFYKKRIYTKRSDSCRTVRQASRWAIMFYDTIVYRSQIQNSTPTHVPYTQQIDKKHLAYVVSTGLPV